jgi:hypothetical protein
MIPDKSNKIWASLLNGEIKHDFKVVSASMLMSRLSRQLKRDNSQKKLKECIDEAYEFFKKYEVIFNEDINEIFK